MVSRFSKNNLVWMACILLLCLATLSAQDNKMPDFTVMTSDGKAVSPATGTVSVFFFFDAALASHKPALQALHQLAYAFRNHKLQVFAVYSDFAPVEAGELAKVVQELTLPFTIHSDLDRLALRKFGVQKSPALFIGDRAGNICYQANAAISYESLRRHTELAFGFTNKEDIAAQASKAPLFTPQAEMTADTEKINKAMLLAQEKPLTPDKPPVTEPDKPVTKPDVIPTDKPDPKPVTPDTQQGNEPKPVATNTAQTGKEQPVPHIPTTTGSFVERVKAAWNDATIAAVVMPDTLGSRPTQWGMSQTAEDAFIFMLLDLWIKLLPLTIWGWGILYCLGKMRRYRRMFFGFLGCFGMFVWHLWYVSLQIPYEFCLLMPELAQWKAVNVTLYGMLYEALPMASTCFSWKLETGLLFLFQCAVVIGIAGRFKNEKEILAACAR